MNDAIIFVSVALFAVWEQRNNGWKYFMGALTGQYTVVPLGEGTITDAAQSNAANNAIIAKHNSVAGASQITPGNTNPSNITTNSKGRGSGNDTKGPPTVGLG